MELGSLSISEVDEVTLYVYKNLPADHTSFHVTIIIPILPYNKQSVQVYGCSLVVSFDGISI